MAAPRYLAVVALAGVALWLIFRKPQAPTGPQAKVPTTLDKPPMPPQASWKCPLDGTRLVLLGDSYADGLRPHLEALAKGCAVPFGAATQVGSGVSKWAVDAGLGTLLDTAKPTLVLVSLGGNDFQRDSASVQVGIAKLVERLRAAGARVVWIDPLSLPFEDKSGARAAWKAAVGEDWFDSRKLDYPRAPDKVHLYPSGYKDWASKIWTWTAALTRGVRL